MTRNVDVSNDGSLNNEHSYLCVMRGFSKT